jgi:transposase
MKTTVSYWRMPEAVWQRMRELIPKRHRKSRGRPPLDARHVADGIYFVMRTGCPWKAVPNELGSGSSLHRYFQEWTACGVFRKLWKRGLVEYDRRRGVAWRWQTIDTAMNKAPLGGEKNREKPHGSWEAWRETVGAHRCSWRGAGTGNRSGQPA